VMGKADHWQGRTHSGLIERQRPEVRRRDIRRQVDAIVVVANEWTPAVVGKGDAILSSLTWNAVALVGLLL